MLEDLEVLRSGEEVSLDDEAEHQTGGRRVHLSLQLPEQEVADVLVVQSSFLQNKQHL